MLGEQDGCTLCGYCIPSRKTPLRVTQRKERLTCAKCIRRCYPLKDQKEAGAMALWRLVGSTMDARPPDYWWAYFVEVADEQVAKAIMAGQLADAAPEWV